MPKDDLMVYLMYEMKLLGYQTIAKENDLFSFFL